MKIRFGKHAAAARALRGAAIAGALALALNFGCSKSYSSNPAGSNGGATATVTMGNYSFSPQVDTVAAGTTVTFKNPSNMHHTVTANNGAFDSGEILAGANWTHTFATAGTFAYQCTYHVYLGMTGTIIVK